HCPEPIQPKGSTSVNKALVMSGRAEFEFADSRRRNIFSPWWRCQNKRDRRVMKSEQSALQVRGLTKRFDRLAVDALDLTVRRGVVPEVAHRSARDLLASLGLEPHLGERCEGFSKGMRQKVALAGALVHDPSLIILDEPLTGLDAVSARHVKGLLSDRVRAGSTVIMTTHILEVAERMADRIGVIAAGRLVAEGTLAELRQQNGRSDTSLEDLFIALVDVEAAAA